MQVTGGAFTGHGAASPYRWNEAASYVNLNRAQHAAGRPVYVMFTQQLRPVLIVLSYH